MTPADLRAIASYCFTTYPVCFRPDSLSKWQVLDADLLADIQHGRFGELATLTQFSVSLRSLHSLTDDELQTVFGIESPLAAPQPIYRSPFGPRVGTLHLNDTGRFMRMHNRQGEYLTNPGGVIAFLQSMGVYVPGVIGEEHVEIA